MFSYICRKLFRHNQWRVVSKPPGDIQRCVMVGAPHTSNWDFIYFVASYSELGLVNPRFTIKKEWMRFPFNYLFGPLGAIPIDRSSKTSGQNRPNMVEQMAQVIKESEQITVLVTPEGTRSPAKRWRTGFYHVALEAKVPILLAYLDYQKREAGIGKIIYPSGDIDKDLREILDFYNDINPKHPENYLKL